MLERAQEELLQAGNGRSDTIDVINYNITLDVTNFSAKIIYGACVVRFTPKIANVTVLPLDLLNLTVDSTLAGDVVLTNSYDGTLLNIDLPAAMNPGDTAEVTVYYHGHPYVDPSGFGGFDFADNIAYNLGIGFSQNPYPVGRTWFPCFDNFVEHATFDLNVLSNDGRKAYCIGTFLDETAIGANTFRRYRMAQELPTYLVGVAVSNYAQVETSHTGVNAEIPITLIGKAPDTAQMKVAFSYLGDAIDALEAWYGPYFWERVGYVLTPVGAMEHCTSIAYPDFVIDQGPDEGMNILMAHELGHHWWGNITTLSSPSDMWIKEGNAEYSAHLFIEHTFGEAAFKEKVKENHLSVLKNAHIDDGGNFLPLSGIPYEYTYGTHTYYKGASVMHNLRGYLGDTLFSQGMRSILQTFPYQAVDAMQFRNQLSDATGLDMTSFFDDWIFSPGFAGYEIDSVHLVPVGSQYQATLFIQQKLRAAPHFHTNVPLEITFFKNNWQTFTAPVTVSGEFSEVTVTVPFSPVFQTINDANRLNLSQMNVRSVVHPGDVNIGRAYVDLSTLDVLNAPDSALINIVHFWVAPDPVPESAGFRLSNSHYWRFDGILPPGFKMKGSLQYKGAGPFDLDHDLTSETEDSIMLVWRPDAVSPWQEYPYYAKLTLGNTNGYGFIRVDTLLLGDYAFANRLVLVGNKDIHSATAINVYPNPASDGFTVEALLPAPAEVTLKLCDALGRVVSRRTLSAGNPEIEEYFDTKDLVPGIYSLYLETGEGELLQAEKIVRR